MEEYKFKQHVRLSAKNKDFPDASEITELSNKIIDLVDNGHYSTQSVLNVLANLHATVGMEAVVSGHLAFHDFVQGFATIACHTLVNKSEEKDRKDINDAIRHLKDTAHLK